MRWAAIITAMLATTIPAGAQIFSPEVIGSDGDYYNGATMRLAWTIGEPIIATFDESSILLTQGFHQPMEESARIAEVATPGGETARALFYPNPFRAQLYVRIPSGWSHCEIEMVNSLGQTVIARQRVEREKFAIDFNTLPSGSYMARIWVRDSSTPQIYHVTRVE